jgi:uncharacterized Zn finger protein
MSELLKPQVSLREQPTVTCESCGSSHFKEIVLIKKVSRLLTGTPNDTLVPFPTYKCDECGHMNKDFDIFNQEESKIDEV